MTSQPSIEAMMNAAQRRIQELESALQPEAMRAGVLEIAAGITRAVFGSATPPDRPPMSHYLEDLGHGTVTMAEAFLTFLQPPVEMGALIHAEGCTMDKYHTGPCNDTT
ncbi:MAG: hypothetical protein ABIJ75_02520 [Actinomycetota bacterium]